MPKFFQNTRYLEHVNINKYLSYTGVNRPGDGPCPLAAYLVTGTGSTSFFGEKYTSGVGDGSLRTLYYGSLLRETMGLTSTKTSTCLYNEMATTETYIQVRDLWIITVSCSI